MAQRIDCLIDTTLMADEIRTVSNHIEGTTTADCRSIGRKTGG